MAPRSTENDSAAPPAFQPVRSLPLNRLVYPDSMVRVGGGGNGVVGAAGAAGAAGACAAGAGACAITTEVNATPANNPSTVTGILMAVPSGTWFARILRRSSYSAEPWCSVESHQPTPRRHAHSLRAARDAQFFEEVAE